MCFGKFGRLFVVATLQMWGLVAEFERESLALRIRTVLVAAFSVGLALGVRQLAPQGGERAERGQ